MSHIIPEPAADAPILDWAKPVTQSLNELRDKRGAMARNERGGALPKLRPWEIHFFPGRTQEDEDFWGVYLPAGSLNVAGEELTPTDSSGTVLVAAGAAYPGYYVIPVASGTSPSAFWLHVYTSEGTGGTSYRATIGASATANAGSGEETLTSIRLCSIASSGAITQLIVGAIVLTPCDCDDDDEPTPDEDPYEPQTDPCEHDPISGNTGGVSADYDITGPGDADYGGVSAGGGVHFGDNDCNCP